MKTTWTEFGRKEGESDEEWAATCRDMAEALAKARGLLPDDRELPLEKDA